MMIFLSNIVTTLQNDIVKIICLLIAIAYFTLAERKIMAAVQRRVGPNVVGPFGLLQPLADGLKLAGKELAIPAQASSRIFLSVAITVLLFALTGWSAIPFGMFDHSEHMSSSNVAKILVLTEPSLNMYHTALECYYAAPESRGFLRFWNTFEDFFRERGYELVHTIGDYDMHPAMVVSKDPLLVMRALSSFFEGSYDKETMAKIDGVWDNWFNTLPWTEEELELLEQNLTDNSAEGMTEYHRIIQRRVLGLLYEPLSLPYEGPRHLPPRRPFDYDAVAAEIARTPTLTRSVVRDIINRHVALSYGLAPEDIDYIYNQSDEFVRALGLKPRFSLEDIAGVKEDIARIFGPEYLNDFEDIDDDEDQNDPYGKKR